MKTLRKVQLTVKFVEFIPEKLEQDVIYVSKEYETAVHLCLCGCGNKSVTPFGLKSNGWNVSLHDDKLTMTPSILNTNCPNRYHYVITNNVASVC